MICWSLWKAKNDFVWSYKVVPKEAVAFSAFNLLDRWKVAARNKVVIGGLDPMVVNAHDN